MLDWCKLWSPVKGSLSLSPDEILLHVLALWFLQRNTGLSTRFTQLRTLRCGKTAQKFLVFLVSRTQGLRYSPNALKLAIKV